MVANLGRSLALRFFFVVVNGPLLAYYRYLNAHGKGTASTVFLFVVAILDAGRNSLSFFLLLVVSLGLSVVRDNLGPTMRKAQILSISHFVFGGDVLRLMQCQVLANWPL